MYSGAQTKDGICTNIAVFDDQKAMAEMGYIPLADGYGIGDIIDNAGNWEKSPHQEEPVSKKPMTLEELSAYIEALEGIE